MKKILSFTLILGMSISMVQAEGLYFEGPDGIREILDNRCSVCHNGGGLSDWTRYKTSRRGCSAIFDRVVRSGDMPPGNYTNMTEEERELVAEWVLDGAPKSEADPNRRKKCFKAD